MNGKTNRSYRFKSFRLDTDERQLLNNDVPIPLTPKAFEVLAYLIERHGHLVEKEELLKSVWRDSFVEEANIPRLIHTLRRALGEGENGNKFIETVAKRGYRFVAEVSTFDNNLDGQTVSGEVKVSTKPLTTPPDFQTNQNDQIEIDSSSKAEIVHSSNTGFKPNFTFIAVCSGIIFSGLILSLGFHLFSNAKNTGERFRQINFIRLTNSGNVNKVALSPDGNLIVYQTDEKEGISIWVRQVGMSNSINLVPPKRGNLSFLTFSPDGKLVYYGFFSGERIDPEVYSVPALGGVSSRRHNITATTMAFAPDGKRFAHIASYMAEGEKSLLIGSLEGADNVRLATRKLPKSFSVVEQPCSWSPDGKSIVVIANDKDAEGSYSTLMSVSVTEGSERAFSSKRWRYLHGLQWLKDGSGLIAVGADAPETPNQVWFVPAGGGEARRLTNDLNEYSFISTDADGKQLVAVQESQMSGIWRGEIGRHSSEYKELSPETGALDTIVSSKPESVIFRSNTGGSSELWTMLTDGGGRRQLTVNAQVDERGLCATPDGTEIVYPSRKAGKVNLWRLNATGGEPRQLTFGGGEFYPVCTPDNRAVIYQDGFGYGIKSTLWKINLDGGEPVQLTDFFAMRPALSSDGHRVAFFYLTAEKWRIGIISSEGGAIEQSIDVPDGVYDRVIHWSPDGKSLYYVDNSDAGNIWSLPLDGQMPIPLTNFDSHQIGDFAVSPNGRELIVTRSKGLSDVVSVMEK